MRYMLLVQATGHYEAGIKPGAAYGKEMAAYREALTGAGVLLAEEWLLPSASGWRIIHPPSGGKPEVLAGPFAADAGLVAGYALIEVASQEEGMAWAMRLPMPGGGGRIEIRELREETQGALRDWSARVMETDLLDQMDMLRRS